MKTITISDETSSTDIILSNEECAALHGNVLSITDWVINAIQNITRRVVNRIILRETDKQPNKLSTQDKIDIIKTLDIKSVAEKNKEIEDEI